MSPFLSSLWSSVGKKAMMGLTGLLMIGFVILHLIGNTLLVFGDADSFNAYAHTLTSMGGVLILAEWILILILVVHVISAISVTRGKMRARPEGYRKKGSAGPPSRKSAASMSMIYTGIVLFIFLVMHISTFKYGPYYTTVVDGEEIRDLYKLVYEVFAQPTYTVAYVVIMTLLGFHLRHGFWSAFQSLGLNHPNYHKTMNTLGLFVAVVLALGFIGIPIWIYLNS